MQINTNAKLRNREDRGFSLSEVITASGIIAVCVVAFTMFMLMTMNALNSSRYNIIATRAANTEVERVRALPWGQLCGFKTAANVSGKTIQTTSDGLPLAITTEVLWDETNSLVECDNNADTGIDLKRLRIVVTYIDATRGGQTQTLELLRSKYA